MDYAFEQTRYAFDPQAAYNSVAWEVFRCCLLRTLFSYPGLPGTRGGARLQPDLATGMPAISPDDLTWTITMKAGLRYAPPFQDREIVAADIVRALERQAMTKLKWRQYGGYASYYSVIAGFDRVKEGRASTIEGLETPDAHTLVVHLARAAPELAALLALPASAPIPPGAADGHEDGYGRFLVSSGPYMFEGSEKLDFTRPAASQAPVEGNDPPKSLTLVRNPSWSRATDELRAANVDRIEFTVAPSLDKSPTIFPDGLADMDLVVDLPPITAKRAELLAAGRLFTMPGSTTYFAFLNLAVPPLDDVHVRKAVNWVLDKDALRSALPADYLQSHGETAVATHLVPDAFLDNLLTFYDPYPSPGHHGDAAKARLEMRQSRYDRNGDGLCEDPVCQKLRVYLSAGSTSPAAVGIIASGLAKIGISVDARRINGWEIDLKPEAHDAMVFGIGWGGDYPDAGNFIEPNFGGASIGSTNFSLVGASSQSLQRWGYGVKSVPSVDREIRQCRAEIGHAAVACWAKLDQELMETVVPWVPYLTPIETRAVSERVARFSFDAFTNEPALDAIALKPGTP